MNQAFWMWVAGATVLAVLLVSAVLTVQRSRRTAARQREAETAALALAQHEARQHAEADAAARARQAEQAEQTARAALAEQDEARAAIASAFREGARLAAEQAAHQAAEQKECAAAQAKAHAAETLAVAARLAALETELQARRDTIAAAAAPGTAAPTSPPAPRAGKDRLVVVADDSKVVRVKTSRLLAQHGYRVVLAEDGAQAAQLIDQEVPLVLITDVEMPHMDGFALTRHVRSHPRAAHIPIIMITSADARLKGAAAEAGVTLVLGKPYEEAALLACIAQTVAAST